MKYFFSARYWSTSAIFSQGSRNLLISNNEVTRSMGNGIMIKSESLSKDYWTQQVREVWSTLIGRGMSRLVSHWSTASIVLLRQQSYAIKNQLVASKAPY